MDTIQSIKKKIYKKIKNPKNASKNILIATGGTGGHIVPALSIVNILIENGYNIFISSDVNLTKYLKQSEIDIKRVKIIDYRVNKHKYTFFSKLSLLFKLITVDLFKFFKYIRNNDIEVVISFGSYASFSPLLAGVLSRKITIIHEQNAIIGNANKVLSNLCDYIFLSFPNTEGMKSNSRNKKKIIHTGMPIRFKFKEIFLSNMNINENALYKIKNNINITILSGSSNVKFLLNKVIIDSIANLSSKNLDIINIYHQVRESDLESTFLFYKNNNISATVSSFFENIEEIMTKSHLIISRSGSSSLNEILAVSAPSILIPLSNSVNNHQQKNAQYAYNNGASIIIDEKSTNEIELINILNRLISNYNNLSMMSKNARKIANVEADARFLLSLKCIYSENTGFLKNY